MMAGSGPMIQELASLLAHGYLRLLARRPESELAAATPDPDLELRNPQNPLDVAGQAKHECERGLRR